MGGGGGIFFDSCCPFSTPLSPKKYVDSLYASLRASRYFASGWIDRERKREQKKNSPPCLPSTLMFKQALMQSLLALQCFCSLSAYFRLALPGWLYRLFFLLFPPLVFKQQQGVSASAGRSDELPEGIKLK